jgi:hypothetical protein
MEGVDARLARSRDKFELSYRRADATSAGFLWRAWAMSGCSIGAWGRTAMRAFATHVY